MELQILFPSGLVLTAASVLTLIYLAALGVLETRGIHLKYSKFFNVASPSSIKVPGRVGMFLLYAPAFLVGPASFWLFPDGDLRFLFLKSAVTVHFFKRLFEALFIHKYSGEMALDTMIIILVSYFTLSSSLVYTQLLTQGLPQPSMDLKYPGLVLFLIGMSGNFYHHCLLSKLRTKGDKDYKIPKGGLFELVICPHYLFEILGLLGISLISQTLYSFSASLGSALYLMGRSYVTRRWYLSKFEDFPKDVKDPPSLLQRMLLADAMGVAYPAIPGLIYGLVSVYVALNSSCNQKKKNLDCEALDIFKSCLFKNLISQN